MVAAQAVLQIKAAEDAGRELLRAANEQARQILREATAESARQCEAIMGEARRERLRLLEEAERQARADSGELVKRGEQERDAMRAPPPERKEKAVEFIIGRIVQV